jgi:geranylgeranyl pyrophosphate synthase
MDEFETSHKHINGILTEYIEHKLVNEGLFKEMLYYATQGGKRLRPMIAYEISTFIINKNIINTNINSSSIVKSIVIFVEFLHCASLILDDMPCMDNDMYRRGNITFHTKYGIKPSYIMSNYMISTVSSELMRHIVRDVTLKPDIVQIIIREMFDNNLLTSLGQIVDLQQTKNQRLHFMTRYHAKIMKNSYFKHFMTSYCNKHNLNLGDTIKSLLWLNMKTFPLFYVSFLLPYLAFSNIDESRDTIIYKIEHLSICFSIIFQMSDDFEDFEKDKHTQKIDSHIKILEYAPLIDLYDQCKCEFIFFTTELFSLGDSPPKLFTYFVELLDKKIKTYDNGRYTK